MFLYIQIGSQEKIQIQIQDLNCTLSEIKNSIFAKTGIAESHQRLVYKGRILTDNPDNEVSISVFGIQEGDTIHVARLSSNKASEEAATAKSLKPNSSSGFEDDIFGRTMDNPLIQSLFNNPEFLSSILENDPRISQMAEKNPEIKSLMRDPKFIKQNMEMMRNPETRKEMMRGLGNFILYN